MSNPPTLGDRIAAALKAAAEQAMRNSNMGQVEAYRANRMINLVEREVAAERERCAAIIRRKMTHHLAVASIQPGGYRRAQEGGGGARRCPRKD